MLNPDGAALAMDIDPTNPKKAAVSLAYRSTIGMGVVFVALVTGLPAAWAIEDLRQPFVLYLSAVWVGLLCSTVLLLYLVAYHKDKPGWWDRVVTANLCLGGLAWFAFSSIAFTARLVQLTCP
jgi:FtsH-binding integral membrane protein